MKVFEKCFENFDRATIEHTRKWFVPFSRFSIFLIYFWFGALKVFSVNHGAAGPLVAALLSKTMPGVAPEPFLIAFGVFEMVLGLIFIIPYLERLGLFILVLHLFTTILPLFILPQITWEGAFVPTLEGQYIIKNILLISLAIGILGHLRTYKKSNG